MGATAILSHHVAPPLNYDCLSDKTFRIHLLGKNFKISKISNTFSIRKISEFQKNIQNLNLQNFRNLPTF